mmetsp:Transcript_1758/g.2466  ORF Transcript_1758/g.2466 Transcript_1758/m.2466 type:complete len:534 (+) Transcript_1758:86-1687(+)
MSADSDSKKTTDVNVTNTNAKNGAVVEVFEEGSFEETSHFYEKTLSSSLSPTILSFLSMNPKQLVARFLHLNPSADPEQLKELVTHKPSWFHWAGADLFCTTDSQGERKMVLIETNSCPSGQKSMPTLANNEFGGYYSLIRHTFYEIVRERERSGELPKDGVLAVIYDKNKMEATGYAAVMAHIFKEKTYLVHSFKTETEPRVRFTDEGVMEVLLDSEDGSDKQTWTTVRAAFRYVTQKPWNRIPLFTKTFVFNPILACLAGGRNKLVADKAYEMLNTQYSGSGLQINLPYTVRHVKLNEIPMWVENFGGFAVVKVPYGNAGQGVWTITSKQELDEFMTLSQDYNQFIVQSLIGNYTWSSKAPTGHLYHLGTVPDKKNRIYVADLRMMVHFDADIGHWRPIAMYARRAENPLLKDPPAPGKSWETLGTNLSVKLGEDKWTSDTSRLILMDQKNFHRLGLGIDDLINGYVQTLMAAVSIDKMCSNLVDDKGNFNANLFRSINPDAALLSEVMNFSSMEKEQLEKQAAASSATSS